MGVVSTVAEPPGTASLPPAAVHSACHMVLASEGVACGVGASVRRTVPNVDSGPSS